MIKNSFSGVITFEEDVPAWLRDWCLWVKELLVPEWDLSIKVVDVPDPQNPRVNAKTSISTEYLDANIVFGRKLEDNTDGHLIACHEVAHVFFVRLGVAQRLAVKAGDAAYKQLKGSIVIDEHNTYEPIMSMVDEEYDNAEEETVVRLSRALVALRGMEKP